MKGKTGRLVKIGAIVLGVVVGLFAVAAVVAPMMVDWNKVRETAQVELSKTLNRQVTIKDLKVSLFSGVEVGGFRIGPTRMKGFTPEPLVKADKVVARYRLLPLLWLKVVIHKIELVQPSLYVEKSKLGKWSFADLSKAAQKPAKPGKDSKPVSLPIGVSVKTIKVSGGSLKYRDASQKPVLTAGYKNLDLQVRNFNISGSPAWMRMSVDTNVKGATIPVSAEGGFSFNLNRSEAGLKNFSVKVPGIEAVTNGNIRELQTVPELDISESVRVDLARAWEGMKSLADGKTAGTLAVTGNVAVDANVKGTAKKIASLMGTVSLRGVGIKYRNITGLFESLEGNINFDANSLKTTGLRFIALDSPFTFDCDFRNLGLKRPQAFSMKTFSPKGKFVLSSPKVVADKALALASDEEEKNGSKKKAKKQEPPAKEPDLRGTVPAGADIEGTIKLEEVRVRRLSVSKQVVALKVKNGLVSFDRTSEMYGGKEKTSGTLNPGKYPLEFGAKMSMKGFDIKSFMDDLMESFVTDKDLAKGRVSGTADLEVNGLTGKGVTMPNIKKALAGRATLNVADGKVSKLEIFEGSLAKILKVDFLSRDVGFKSLGGNFDIAQGRATTKDFTMDPGADGDLGVLYKGYVDFDTAMKGTLTTRFHPRHADSVMKGDVGKTLFTKENGWAVGDWDVKGTLKKPVLTPSMKQVKKAATQKATQEIKEEGKKLLKNIFKK